MDNFLIALNVVFPIAVMMLIGVQVKRKGLVTEESLTVMNKLIFRVFMSSLLFTNISTMRKEDILKQENLYLIGIVWGAIIFITVICTFAFQKTVKDRSIVPVLVQGAYRSNLALFGIPMAMSLYGEKGLGLMSLISAAVIPLTNAIAVCLLESYATKNINYKKIGKSLVTNPLIICSFLSLTLILLEIKLPQIIMNPLFSLGRVATPLSFVVLGATLNFSNIVKNMKLSFYANSVKLLFLPLITVGIGLKLGFTNEALLGILGATGSPGAVSSFIMVKEIGGDEQLAAELVVSSTLLSILTLFLWIFILKNLGYL